MVMVFSILLTNFAFSNIIDIVENNSASRVGRLNTTQNARVINPSPKGANYTVIKPV